MRHKPAPHTAETAEAPPPQLSDLIAPGDHQAVIDEVTYLQGVHAPPGDVAVVRRAFEITADLFAGRWPGYQACNTEYHNFQHTTDVFLAMARMVHGAEVDGIRFAPRLVVTAFVAALLHDVGYIQTADDTFGTGARHTAEHVDRGIAFMGRHGESFQLSAVEIECSQLMILSTDLGPGPGALEFEDPQAHMLARMLSASDLMAQMADRTYLEKLLFLYREFSEAGIGGFQSERDLLEKTVSFYQNIEARLRTTLDGMDHFLGLHFAARWNIPSDLYRVGIDNQKQYLKMILSRPETNHRQFLKRGGIVACLSQPA